MSTNSAFVCLAISFFLSVAAQICPLREHQVCNDHTKQLRCVCAMSVDEEAPPEQSCTNLVDTQTINAFESVTITFQLDEAAKTLDSFPEDRFREQLANLLRLDQKDILVIRVHCLADDTKFAVQFVVVKNEDNDDDNDGIKDSEDDDDARVPFGQDHFLKSAGLVHRLKVIGPMHTLAGIHVDSIKMLPELYPIEPYVDNTILIIQASLAAIFISMTCLCGCWIVCKRSDYEADLQKAPGI